MGATCRAPVCPWTPRIEREDLCAARWMPVCRCNAGKMRKPDRHTDAIGATRALADRRAKQTPYSSGDKHGHGAPQHHANRGAPNVGPACPSA